MLKIRKQIITLIFLYVMLSGVVITKANDTNKCGENLTWSLTDNGVLSITGTGEMYDYSVTDAVYAPWYEQSASILTIEIGNGVTRIGNDAFYSCSAVTNVSMADSVISIGRQAFYKCSATTIEISENVNEIGEYAFQETKFQSIVLPKGLVTVGEGIFQSSNLTSIILPDSLTYISDKMFLGSFYLYDVDFPKTLKTIGESAFSSCYALNNLVLPEGADSHL